MLTRALGTFFANLMPFIILIQAAAAVVFMQNLASRFGIRQQELQDKLLNQIKNTTEYQEAAAKAGDA